MATLLSYGANKLTTKFMGRAAISLLSPCVEEVLKTGSAVVFSVSVLTVHTVFGVFEALAEIKRSKKAAILAVITHIAFGTVTVTLLPLIGVLGGVAASVLLHMLWNSYIYDLVNLQRKD